MTDRYISVKALKSKLNYIFRVCGTSNVVKETVIEGINRLSSADVVEVVRCKDCKYYQTATVNEKGFLICPASGMEITEIDYCSYGERKEE